MTLTRSRTAALLTAVMNTHTDQSPASQPSATPDPMDLSEQPSSEQPTPQRRRKRSRDWSGRVAKALGPKVSQFLASYGPTCTAGCEASFTVEALNYARSKWTSESTKRLTLAAAAELCVVEGDGLTRYFKGRAGGRIMYRCAVCKRHKPCEIAEVLKHVGEEHAKPGERGMEWELQSWPMELPIRGVGRAWKKSKHVKLDKEGDDGDGKKAVPEKKRKIRIKIIFKVPKPEEDSVVEPVADEPVVEPVVDPVVNPVADEGDVLNKEIYSMFEDSRK